MRTTITLLLLLSLTLCSVTTKALETVKPVPVDLGEIPATTESFILWQLPAQTGTQIMSYVIRTANGKIIVVDGGMPKDAPYLRRFLATLGNHVDVWFISHPHSDHASALIEIANSLEGITIDRVYASLPTVEWMEEREPATVKTLSGLNEALAKAKLTVTTPLLGDEFTIDGIHVEILGVQNPEIKPNACNNSCLVWRMADEKKSVLFLGDLGHEGGQKILASPYRDRLPSDYVQMAHHGQAGVSEEFYTVVSPTHCLWPTPIWLWDVDNGKGKGSGPWLTLEVRAWMEKLGVTSHFVMKDGLARIE